MRYLSKLANSTVAAVACRYLCHCAMLAAAVANELRPAPSLPDRVLVALPYVRWLDEHNYHLWVLAYCPLAIVLWRVDRTKFLQFMYAGSALSLLRGVCIGLTGLGPVHGGDANVNMTLDSAVQAWCDLVNPVAALTSDAPRLMMTKDLFFSGHTASTFLLLLYCWTLPRLRWIAVGAHVAVVAVVLLSRLHYSIDVVGAWAITYCTYSAADRLRTRLGPAVSMR